MKIKPSLKKKLPFIAVGIIVLAIAGFFVFKNLTKKPEPEPEPEPEKTKITEPVNTIPVSQRPYLQIIPNRQYFVTIAVNDLKKEAADMEYELEYESGSLLQGAFGQIDVSSVPVEEEIRLGSCSAGGSCTHHEDVKGGILVTRFSGGEEAYALKNYWRYFENDGSLTDVSSRDAKFQLSSEGLSGNYLIVFNSPGAPEGLEKEFISDIYTLSSSSQLTGTGELLIRAEEESESAMIMGYDGEDWVEFETSSEGKQVTAEVELLPLYVVASE